jgi:hypothetical protein
MEYAQHSGKLFVWMQLLGLDREKSDYGVGEWIGTMGTKPDGVCLFTPHPDIIHEHAGMETEYALHPDDCAYCAIPKNTVRERQEWTNYDLRGAVRELKSAGIEPYLSIQGAFYDNLFHREWITDHPELHRYTRLGTREGILPLKRLADGSYYEDFFIEKLCQTLTDYSLSGIQLADGFCPSGVIHYADFSRDFVEQFLVYSKLSPPDDFLKSMQSDATPELALRASWIWKEARAEWIKFWNWRWEQFFKKLCSAVHSINKKVIVLAVYCTDPFETQYCLGIDLKRIMAAGVDYLMPNTLPTSVHFNGRTERFWRYMTTVTLNAAFLDGTRQLCMLGVKDSTEEWDALQDTPCMFQRDIYTLLGQQLITKDGCRRATDGIMICLGDAIDGDEWNYLNKHFAAAYTHGVEKVLTPTVLWSDSSFYNTLPAVCESGRWSTHKFLYEAAKRGAPCYAAVRIENIKNASGTLFVPNIDLLTRDEQIQLLSYDEAPIVATAPADFDLSALGIEPSLSFVDEATSFPMKAFAFGKALPKELPLEIHRLLATPNVNSPQSSSISEAPDWMSTLAETVPFINHSSGFLSSLSYLLYHANDANMPFICEGAYRKDRYDRCDCPHALLKLTNGKYRLFLYNPERERYRPVSVISKKGIIDAQVISYYPILPVKFNNCSTDQGYVYKYSEESESALLRDFSTKIKPNGITVIDITLSDDSIKNSTF